MRLKKILISMVAVIGLAGLFGFTGSKAEAASGYVMDGNQRPIVGMWVEVENGTSGWAAIRNGNPNQPYNKVWSYNTQGKRWKVSVGVGGTPQQWQDSINSGWVGWQGSNVQINTAYHWLFGNQISITP